MGGFQNPGVCLQAFPSFLPLRFPSPLFYSLHSSPCNSLLPNCTETLATQANSHLNFQSTLVHQCNSYSLYAYSNLNLDACAQLIPNQDFLVSGFKFRPERRAFVTADRKPADSEDEIERPATFNSLFRKKRNRECLPS